MFYNATYIFFRRYFLEEKLFWRRVNIGEWSVGEIPPKEMEMKKTLLSHNYIKKGVNHPLNDLHLNNRVFIFLNQKNKSGNENIPAKILDIVIFNFF